jgi:hypothetical protein
MTDSTPYSQKRVSRGNIVLEINTDIETPWAKDRRCGFSTNTLLISLNHSLTLIITERPVFGKSRAHSLTTVGKGHRDHFLLRVVFPTPSAAAES